MGALRLTSLCWDSVDHRGWGDAARGRVSHQGLRDNLCLMQIYWGGSGPACPTVLLVTLGSCKLP